MRKLILALALAAVAPAALAEKADREKEVQVLADRLTADDTKLDIKGRVTDGKARGIIARNLVTHPRLVFMDEPTTGLHPADVELLMAQLHRLVDAGNTVIVVEHDEDAIKLADYMVDIGPGAGVNGGHIVAQGTPAEVMANPNSLTGKYLVGIEQVPLPKQRRKWEKKRSIRITGARANNLKKRLG